MKFYASTHSGGHWPGKWEVHLIAWDMQKIKILLAFLSRNLRCRLDMCAVPGVPCVKSNLHSWGCKIILSFKLLYNIKILLNLVRRSSNFELLQLHYHKNRRLVSVLFHLNLSLTHTLRKNGKTYPAGGRWCGFIKSRNLVRKKEGEWYRKFFSNFLLQRSCLEHTLRGLTSMKYSNKVLQNCYILCIRKPMKSFFISCQFTFLRYEYPGRYNNRVFMR